MNQVVTLKIVTDLLTLCLPSSSNTAQRGFISLREYARWNKCWNKHTCCTRASEQHEHEPMALLHVITPSLPAEFPLGKFLCLFLNKSINMCTQTNKLFSVHVPPECLKVLTTSFADSFSEENWDICSSVTSPSWTKPRLLCRRRDSDCYSVGYSAADNLLHDLSARRLHVKSWINHSALSALLHRCDSSFLALNVLARSTHKEPTPSPADVQNAAQQNSNIHPSQMGHAAVQSGRCELLRMVLTHAAADQIFYISS